MFVIKHLELIKFSRLINLQGVDMPYPKQILNKLININQI